MRGARHSHHSLNERPERRIALIVEPDAAKRAVAAATLRGMGFKTYQTGCGGVGQFMASQLTLNAVVVDVVLPDLDGFQLIRRVRATSPEAVIVATAPAGDDWDAIAADAQAAGADFALGSFAGDALGAVLKDGSPPPAAPIATLNRS